MSGFVNHNSEQQPLVVVVKKKNKVYVCVIVICARGFQVSQSCEGLIFLSIQ